MKRKKLSLLLACAIATTSILSPLDFSSVSANTVEVIEMAKHNAEVSLIDLGYVNDNSLTYTRYKDIKLNQNTDGLPIQLKLFGETVQFEKGISAHAESSIVYDIEEYSEEFTHLRGYAGVDTRQSGKGNGVIFSIQTSEDGVEWVEKFKSNAQKGESECVILNVDITGAKYIKVFANHNGGNGNDHAVYGNLRLVDASKDKERGLLAEGIKTVAEYDEILKAKGDAIEVAESNKLLVYQRELVNRVGFEALNELYRLNPEYREGIDYIFNNEQALAYYMEAGLPDGGSQVQAVLNFAKIYDKYSSEIKNDQKFLLKLAVSIALSHSKQVAFWMGTAKPHDPVMRYESYKYLITSGLMAEGGDVDVFKNLPSALMQHTVNTRLHEDEVVWLAEYALKKKESFQDKNHLNSYNYITYTGDYNYTEAQYYDTAKKSQWDAEYDLSGFSDYGTTGIVRNFMVFEEGAVCGGLAKTYATLNEVFGKPSGVVNQPGHAATLSYTINGNNEAVWVIQNDVYGWTQSRDELGQMPLTWGVQSWNSDRSASYILLTQAVLEDYENYAKTVRLNIMADVYKDDVEESQRILSKALEYQGTQLDSMVKLINTYKQDETKDSDDYLALAKTIAEDFKYYPLPMKDLLNLIKSEIDEADIPKFNLVKNSALVEASIVADGTVRQADVTRIMANHVLSTDRVDFASFSFDGSNSNKIIVRPEYKDIVGKVKYSLNGGDSWITTDSHTIQLNAEQIKSINAEDDILVGIDGFDVADRIDIKTQVAPKSDKIEVNDRENTFVGSINNLQFLNNTNKQWVDYVEDGVFSGTQTISVRYKANGQYLASESVDYNLTENNDAPEKKYVPLSNFEVLDVSSEQSTGMIKNLFDGSSNTHFHTSNDGDSEREIILELKDSKFINTMVYESYTQQGRAIKFEVYGSADGNTWTLMEDKGFKEQTLTEISLSKPMEVKFLKIVAKETVAKDYVEANTNKFFSGKGIHFYEDATKPSVIDDAKVSANSTIKKAILDEKARIEAEKKAKEEAEKEEATTTQPTESKVKVDVVYDVSADNKSVTATLVATDGEIKLAEGIKETVTLDVNNPNYVFQYTDDLGRAVAKEADIKWIEQDIELPGFGKVRFSGLNTVKISNPVTVYFMLDKDVVMVNNDGNHYTFNENGNRVFKIKNNKTGEITIVPVNVDWIYK